MRFYGDIKQENPKRDTDFTPDTYRVYPVKVQAESAPHTHYAIGIQFHPNKVRRKPSR